MSVHILTTQIMFIAAQIHLELHFLCRIARWYCRVPYRRREDTRPVQLIPHNLLLSDHAVDGQIHPAGLVAFGAPRNYKRQAKQEVKVI